MAEAKPGDKRCDRCDGYAATSFKIRRTFTPPASSDAPATDKVVTEADLCARCTTIVDNAIKRAVKPK